MAAKNQAPIAEPQKATGEDVEEIVISENDTTSTNKKFIQYIGNATDRIITKKDWKGIGVEGDNVKDSLWDFKNGHKLPSEDFTEQQLTYLLKVDGRFKAVDK